MAQGVALMVSPAGLTNWTVNALALSTLGMTVIQHQLAGTKGENSANRWKKGTRSCSVHGPAHQAGSQLEEWQDLRSLNFLIRHDSAWVRSQFASRLMSLIRQLAGPWSLKARPGRKNPFLGCILADQDSLQRRRMQGHLRKYQPCHLGNQHEHVWEWACRRYLWQGNGVWAKT